MTGIPRLLVIIIAFYLLFHTDMREDDATTSENGVAPTEKGDSKK